MLQVEGVFHKDVRFNMLKVDVLWENTSLYYYVIEIFKHYKPGDNWHYDLYWKVPYYAPSGSYRINLVLQGLVEEADTEFDLS